MNVALNIKIFPMRTLLILDLINALIDFRSIVAC